MKTTTLPSLSLVFLSTLASWAQETPTAPPAPPEPALLAAETVEIQVGADVASQAPAAVSVSSSESGSTTASGSGKTGDVQFAQEEQVKTESLPGGKLLISTGEGDKRTVEILDVASKESADSPLRFNFDAKTKFRKSGPVTFMGVSVTPAPDDLSVHLPLPKGTGLVVQNVSKDSPAAKAGVQENDILTKLDDQILIHPAQFSVLIAGKKEGDSVKLSILRKGAAQELAVTLGKSEGGDPLREAGTLKFGDVEVRVGDDAEARPLRTYIKSWAVDGNSPQVRELKMRSGDGGEIQISGDHLKIADGKMRAFNDILKGKNEKVREEVQKRIEEAVRRQQEAMARMAAKQAAKDSGEASKDAAEASEKAAEAKKQAIQELEETLRRLKEE